MVGQWVEWKRPVSVDSESIAQSDRALWRVDRRSDDPRRISSTEPSAAFEAVIFVGIDGRNHGSGTLACPGDDHSFWSSETCSLGNIDTFFRAIS